MFHLVGTLSFDCLILDFFFLLVGLGLELRLPACKEVSDYPVPDYLILEIDFECASYISLKSPPIHEI
jgi:hypothetical protein